MPSVRSMYVLAALLGSSGACGDHLVTDPEQPVDDRKPACMLMIGTYGYWADQDTPRIIQDLDGYVAVSCMCLDEEAFHDTEPRLQMSDQLFDKCESLSHSLEFDMDECEEDYLSDAWVPYVYWAHAGDVAQRVPESLPCK